MERKITVFLLVLVMGTFVFSNPAQAAIVRWNIIATGCVPNLNDAAVSDITMSSDAYGAYITTNDTATPYPWFWCPIFMDDGVTIDQIGAKWYDGSTTSGVYIKLYLYEQDINCTPSCGAADLIVTFDSENYDATANPDYDSQNFDELTVDNDEQVYFILGTMAAILNSEPRLYSISLIDN